MTMPAASSPEPLADALGRRVRYLRLSLTDRCNFACTYCSPRPSRGGDALPREGLVRLVRVFLALGVERVRLTGGEPTLRPDLLEIVRELAALPGLRELALTTNGHLLERLASPLRDAGVSRVNVSLDTLRPERLAAIAGRAASLPRLVAGVAAAAAAGFEALKLNTVVVRGVNDDELGELARFAWRHGAVPRFIELMPFGAAGEPVPTREVERLLRAQGVALEPDPARGWGPARYMRGAFRQEPDHAGLVGFIGAMTECFCADCNRVRVSADGSLRPCLGGRQHLALAPLLRDEPDDQALAERIREAIRQKGERHALADTPGLPRMVGLGG